jgi:hypothetical protein
MRCSLGAVVLLAVAASIGVSSAQTTSRDVGGRADTQKGDSRKEKGRPARTPAARYSPLAAAGGYSGAYRVTWYEAALHSLNPKGIDWGERWEARRRVFLENWATNRYFLFSALLLVLVILVAIGWAWNREDHRRKKLDLAHRAAAARNYANYWENRATGAFDRYNDHIEKCNRVVEAGEVLGDAGDAVTLRSELERLRQELADAETRNRGLEEQLQRKTASVAELSARVDEATRKFAGGSSAGGNGQTPALVERINRLEDENRKLRAENRNLKGA